MSAGRHGHQDLKLKKEQRKKWKYQKLINSIKKEDLPSIKESASLVQNVKEINSSKLSNNASVPRLSTLTIAVPGSILDNAQSVPLRAYLAGQIARAACIFKVNEIVVFNDVVEVANELNQKETVNGVTVRRCCSQLARILQYLECPQYLRRHIFPMHEDLEYAGLINPLDSPHHLRQNDEFTFREGIVTNKPGKTSYVNVGLLRDVTVDRNLSAGLRVTVKLLESQEGVKKKKGVIVSPTQPLAETGTYWGYSVRIANSITEVISQSPYKGGYDVSIGTSDKGTNIDQLQSELPKYEHAIIVFGGLQGLEQALESDPESIVDEPSLMFDYYVNTCPDQGSKTIRTEEAILISLAELRKKFFPKTLFIQN